MSKESNVAILSEVFSTKSGDVFVKVDDKHCAYLGNLQKDKTDFTLLFPLLQDNEVEVISTVDVSFVNKEYQN